MATAERRRGVGTWLATGLALGAGLVVCAGPVQAAGSHSGAADLRGPASRRAFRSGRSARSRPADIRIKVGRVAPDFTLPRLKFSTDSDGKTVGRITTEKVALSSFRGKKPVCLILSSYT